MRGLYGDVRTIEFNEAVDAIVEWWCIFHLPKSDHELMIARFAKWLRPGGILEFTAAIVNMKGLTVICLTKSFIFTASILQFMNNILKNMALKFF